MRGRSSLIALALLLGASLAGCGQSDVDRTLDDPNIPIGSTINIWEDRFTLQPGATGPMAQKLFDPDVPEGAEFSIGSRRYVKLGNGVGWIR